MNENPETNQMTKARWEEMCLQHVALAMIIGDLKHEVRMLRSMVVGLAQAGGTELQLEDRTGPAHGEEQGAEHYRAILLALRKGMAEAPPQP